jgi:hypothetical protein
MELTDSSGSYTGLFVVGEKAIPQGFQTMAEFILDTPAKRIPTAKLEEISQIVQSEFVKRGVAQLRK